MAMPSPSTLLSTHLRGLREGEIHTEDLALPHVDAARLRVAVVYANTYAIAMGNLGFQMVQHLFNQHSGVVAERFFLPSETEFALYQKSGSPLLSLESGRPLSDFDLVAFSLSFENDYLNIPQILHLGRIPLWRKERGARDPILLAGGAAIGINGEPIADFFDLLFVGEGEDAIPEMAARWDPAHSKDAQLDALASVAGCYRSDRVPEIAVPDCDPLRIAELADGIPRTRLATLRQYKRRRVAHFDAHAIHSQILSPEAEFGQMFLIEMQRGCSRGCKFCAEGFVYLPFRQEPMEKLKRQVELGLRFRKKIGLIGADLLVHPHFAEICRFIHERGGTFSPSSVRVDALSDEVIDLLAESGHQTIALAPEGGSERLRFALNKKFTNAQIIDAAARLARKGIPNIKLYVIAGLPNESEADLAETVHLVKEVKAAVVAESKSRGHLGRVILSLNPFIPKPRTPYQNSPFRGVDYYKGAIRTLQSKLCALGGIKVNVESPVWSQVQVLLSNGNREVSRFIAAYSQNPGAFRGLLRDFINKKALDGMRQEAL